MTATNPRRAAAKKTVAKKRLPRQTQDTPDISTVTVESGEESVPAVKFKRLTQEDIRQAKDITEEEFFVEEWEGNILLRSLSMRKLLGIIDSQDDGTVSVNDVQGMNMDLEPAMKEMIQGAVVDPVVSDEDFEEWMERSAAAVMSIFQKILKLSKLEGMTKDGQNKSLEEEVAQFR